MVQTDEESNLTFSQRNGFEPLPTRLRLGEFDERARNILYSALHDLLVHNSHLTNYLDGTYLLKEGKFRNILRDLVVEHWGGKIRDFSELRYKWEKLFEEYLVRGRFNEILDVLEFIMTHKLADNGVIQSFQRKFKSANIAYFVDDTGCIMPIISEEEAKVIQEALALTKVPALKAARNHLLSAGKHINNDKWADSIRESIHAVEAVGRLILKNPSATLGDFIKSCDKRANIHPQLKEMLKKFSAYADDHARHADKPDSSTPPDMADAVLLFGACASFVTYLINKSGLNGAAEVS